MPAFGGGFSQARPVAGPQQTSVRGGYGTPYAPRSPLETRLAAWAGPGYYNPAQPNPNRPRMGGTLSPKVWA